LILLSNETLVLVFAVVLMLGGLAGFWVSLARGTKHGRQTAKLLGCNYCFVVEQRWAAELLRAACDFGATYSDIVRDPHDA
jgi:hypothetical protein